MDPRAEDLALKRLRLFARVCFCWALLLLARLFQLQVLDHHHYAHLAQRQQERNVELRAPRGAILDRNGLPLAMSVPVDSVCINPMRLRDPAVAAGILSRVLNLNENELLSRITTAVEARRGFLWIKRKVDAEEAERLRAYNLDWVEFRSESTRFYPKETLAAHLLGGVDHEEHGNGGIEQYFEDQLRGKPGIMRTTADVRRNVFDSEVFTDPQPGANVTLTIDERIQHVAETELAKAVIGSDASAGSLVVMDPRNGEVLALANYPTYNPNIAPKSDDEFRARANLSVTAPFEPGSVFKVITIATALQTTRLTPETPFFCHNGAFTLFRRVIHDAKPHGTLTMAEVLAKSSNIGAIKVALAVGNDKMYEYIRAFGFGEKTGLPLPGESAGTLRKPSKWIASSIGSIAMGHELSTTSVQLARACSVIANGGFLVKPKLVVDESNEADEMQPVLRPENAMKMRVMMRMVVDKGTGKLARPKGYSAAGKTGSAQIYDHALRAYIRRYNGSFMGFAPVNNPRVVIVVTLNRTRTGSQGFGGVVAAPVFRNVAAAALRFLDVPPDVPEDSQPADSATPIDPDLSSPDLAQPPDAEEGEAFTPLQLASASESEEESFEPPGPRVPDFSGKTKREVFQEALALGIRTEMSGTGVVRRQEPLPGVALLPNQTVKVVFAR